MTLVREDGRAYSKNMLGKLTRFVAGRLKKHRAEKELAMIAATAGRKERPDLSPPAWKRSLEDPTGFYLDCARFFYAGLPPALSAHRAYFRQKGRGFGEDAFHVMWWLLFGEFRPARFLEIGVYRGQTLSLAALLQSHFSIAPQVTGISPFTAAGDAVSRYRKDVPYLEDTLLNFAHFGLPAPELVPAFSTDPAAIDRLAATAWDCVYIDGNHDYDIALQDWRHCSDALKPGGVIVLDDSALGTAYHPPSFASAGHPGPSRIAAEINPHEFIEILRVGHNRAFQKLA